MTTISFFPPCVGRIPISSNLGLLNIRLWNVFAALFFHARRVILQVSIGAMHHLLAHNFKQLWVFIWVCELCTYDLIYVTRMDLFLES